MTHYAEFIEDEQADRLEEIILYNGSLEELDSRPGFRGKYTFAKELRYEYAGELIESRLREKGYVGLVNLKTHESSDGFINYEGTPIVKAERKIENPEAGKCS